MSDALHRSELEFLMLGNKIGEGVSRKVYVMNDPRGWGWSLETTVPAHLDGLSDEAGSPFVIKVEEPGGRFQNVQEWAVWTWVRGSPMAKWFAPCVAISPCGLYLIQHRVEPLRPKDRPKLLPEFLVDVHRHNLGLYDGRVVCCDYGTGVAAIRTASRKMQRIKWS